MKILFISSALIVLFSCGSDTSSPDDPVEITIDSENDLERTDVGHDTHQRDISDSSDTDSSDTTDEEDVSESPEFDTEAIDALIDRYLAGGSHAIGVAIVRDGVVVYANAKGVRGPDNAPADDETVFAIGSASKMMTGYALTALADQGSLNLTDPVTQFVDLEYSDDIDHDDVTSEHLLNHTAGVGPSNFSYYGSLGGAFESPMDRWVAPALIYNYSNYGFNLLGWVGAKAAGTNYAEMLKATTITDFGLPHATADRAEAQARNHAKGETGDPQFPYVSPIDHDDFSMPSGGIWMSATDLGIVLQRILGEASDPAIQPRLDAWLTPSIETRGKANEFYGNGLFFDGSRTPATVGHPGQISAYTTWVETVPERNSGVAVIASSTTQPVWEIAGEVFEQLGISFTPRTDVPIDLDLDSIEGTYVDTFTYGSITVSRNANGVFIDCPDYGISNQNLREFEPNVFFYFDPVWQTYLGLTFWPDEDGRVKYVASRLGVATRVE